MHKKIIWNTSGSSLKLLILLVLSTCMLVNGQVTRDIILQFMSLDKNIDYLLSPQEIKHLGIKSQEKDKYHNLYSYKKNIYPFYFWKVFDTNQNNKIQKTELKQIINKQWKLYANLWLRTPGLLAFFDESQYLNTCDANKDGILQQNQFGPCINAVLAFDIKNYPWAIKSALYKDQKKSYTYQQFVKLMPEAKAEGLVYEKYMKKLFDNLEWDNDKVEDSDEAIGSQQGIFLEPIALMSYLDANFNGQLDHNQALKYFKFDQVLKIVDKDQNDKIDRFQFLSYHAFARCINCNKPKSQQGSGSKDATKSQKKQDSKGDSKQPDQVLQL